MVQGVELVRDLKLELRLLFKELNQLEIQDLNWACDSRVELG